MASVYRVLFLHKELPAQFLHLMRDVAADSRFDVRAVSEHPRSLPSAIRVYRYRFDANAASRCHAYVHGISQAVQRGQQVAVVCLELRRSGWNPDLIVGHNGWGELLYLKDVWPATPLIGYFEFFYRARGVDLDFDLEFPASLHDAARVRTMNAVNLLGLDAVDLGWTPTAWQKSLYPEVWRQRLVEIHDGIDTDEAQPNDHARVHLPDGRELTAADEVVSYVARSLEPYRGFHMFMRALPEILRRRPAVHIVIAGGDDVSYGCPPPEASSWRWHLLREIGAQIDLSRVHFVGELPRRAYLDLLRVGAAHVYLTYPFVLSWSCLEAMSAGALVVGSATPPVLEAVRHGETGLLVPFHDREALVQAVCTALESRLALLPIRRAARAAVISRYDALRVCVPAMRRILTERFDAPAAP